MLKLRHKGYKENNLRKYVNELTTSERGEILRYDSDADIYAFSNPFIKVYAYCILNTKKDDSIITKAQLLEYFKDTLHNELEEARKLFMKDLLEATEEDTFIDIDDDEF